MPTKQSHPSHAAAHALMSRSLRTLAAYHLRTLAAYHRLTPEVRRENTLANFRTEIALQHYLVKLGVVGAQERLDQIAAEFLDYGMHEGRAAIERAGTYSREDSHE